MTTYTAIPDSDIDPESPITTGLMTLMRDNPIAITEGASGAPRIVQGALSTATAAQSAATGTAAGNVATITLTGGLYTWWSFSGSVAGSANSRNALLGGSGDLAAGVLGIINGNLADSTSVSGAVTGYIDERYVQASPPYDFGDGEIPLFISALLDKTTLDILGVSVAPDPIWAYNGPHQVFARQVINGRHYMKMPPPGTPKLSAQERINAALRGEPEPEPQWVEITQNMKLLDKDAVPHTWHRNDMTDKVVVMLEPNGKLVESLRKIYDTDGATEIRNLIHSGLLDISNEEAQTAWQRPSGVLIVKGRLK